VNWQRFPHACRLLAIPAIFWIALGSSWASGPKPLFDDDRLLEIELHGPLAATLDDRDDRAERPFLLKAEGRQWDVLVRVRGHSRSRRSVCAFPPLRLRFEGATGVFAGQEKLKLVTHCQSSARGDADVMEEYLAYRAFNLLSESSFRVRPLRITYIDTHDPDENPPGHRYGFFIEPAEQLAARIGGVPIDLEGVSLARLNPQQAALVYVFQYLIGNTDWSLVTSDTKEHCCHNGLLFDVGGRVDYVPYDFDLSGLVDARYAEPDPSLRIPNVRVRRYRGYCTSPGVLAAAVQKTRESETAMFAIVSDAPGLDEDKRAEAIEYLEWFFDRAADKEKLLKKFDAYCKD
jgi:hypothetical protein